jgi:hypothetical protein
VLAELVRNIDLRLASLSLELGWGIRIMSLAGLAQAFCIRVSMLDRYFYSAVEATAL